MDDTQKYEADKGFLDVELIEIEIDYIFISVNEWVFRVKINGVERDFEPYYFCTLLTVIHSSKAIKIKDADDLILSAVIYSELRIALVNWIEDFKRKLETIDIETIKKYDFSIIYLRVDSLLERSKFLLETRLLLSQVETNKNTRTTNYFLKWILSLTALIYFGQLLFSIFSGKETPTQLQLKMQDSLAKTMEIRLYQKEIQQYRYLVEIDSLKNALDSAK